MAQFSVLVILRIVYTFIVLKKKLRWYYIHLPSKPNLNILIFQPKKWKCSNVEILNLLELFLKSSIEIFDTKSHVTYVSHYIRARHHWRLRSPPSGPLGCEITPIARHILIQEVALFKGALFKGPYCSTEELVSLF